MDIDLASYKELYLTSARENVHGMRTALEVLSAEPANTNAVESVFIKSHTLKGQSMTMGYTGIAKAALAIERYMRLVREHKAVPNKTTIPVVTAALDKLAASLTNVAEKDREVPMSETITELEQVLGVKI